MQRIATAEFPYIQVNRSLRVPPNDKHVIATIIIDILIDVHNRIVRGRWDQDTTMDFSAESGRVSGGAVIVAVVSSTSPEFIRSGAIRAPAEMLPEKIARPVTVHITKMICRHQA